MAVADKHNSRISRNTAEGDASLRAAGVWMRRASLRNPDYLAPKLISGGLTIAAMTKLRPLQPVARRLFEAVLPGAFWVESARVRHFDALLERHLDLGARQLLLLGAGYDSRAYRFAERLTGVPVFELDLPSVIEAKRERVAAVVGRSQVDVRHVAADLEQQDFPGLLAEAGYSTDLHTFCIWCGVAPYMSEAAADTVLRWFATHPAPSTIAFDYAWREWIDGDDSFYGARQVRQAVEKMGEPYRFGIGRDEAGAFLGERGLQLVEEISFQRAVERYLGREGVGRGWDFGVVAEATVAHPHGNGVPGP